MVIRAKGIKPVEWEIPESLMDFDVPEELKTLENSEEPFLLHDCGKHIKMAHFYSSFFKMHNFLKIYSHTWCVCALGLCMFFEMQFSI